MSEQDSAAYRLITKALPHAYVLMHVPIYRFIHVTERYSYGVWLRKIGYHTANLVICDRGGRVITVIELMNRDKPLGDSKRKRYVRMSKIFAASNIAFHVWNELPRSQESLRAALRINTPFDSESESSSAQVRSIPSAFAATSNFPESAAFRTTQAPLDIPVESARESRRFPTLPLRSEVQPGRHGVAPKRAANGR